MDDITKKSFLLLIKKIINIRKTINKLEIECDKLLLENQYLITDQEKLSDKKYKRFVENKFVLNFNHNNLIAIINGFEDGNDLLIMYYAYIAMNTYKKAKLHIIYLGEFMNEVKNKNENLLKLTIIQSSIINTATNILTSKLEGLGFSSKTVGVVGLADADGNYTLFSPTSVEQKGGQIGGGMRILLIIPGIWGVGLFLTFIGWIFTNLYILFKKKSEDTF